MKRLSKTLLLFFMMLVFTLIPAQSSMAASKYPGNVKKLTLKTVSDTSVKLTWSKATNATGYRINIVDPATGTAKKATSTKNTTCTIKNLEIDETYTFQVLAYRKVGGKYYYSKSGSPMKSVKTKMSTPGAVKNFRFICNGNKSIFLAWNKASNADRYIIYQKNDETGEYEKIATTKDTTYQVKKLTAGEKYSFKVQAYHAVQGLKTYGKMSSAVSAKAKTVNVSAVHGRYWEATVKTKTTATNKETGKKVTLKKGTKVTATKKGSGTLTAVLSNGTKVSVKGNKLTYGNLAISSKKYSTAQKEAFVNGRGYSSPTNYLIWVNQYTCTYTIFKGSKGAWKVARTSKCVVGKLGNTPVGVYKICRKTTWEGQPLLYFTWNGKTQKGNAFHRLLNGRTTGALSGGCVRLPKAELEYMKKYCDIGTTVVCY